MLSVFLLSADSLLLSGAKAESEERIGRQIRKQNEASDQILEDVYNGTTVAIKERRLGEGEEEFESDGTSRESIQQMYKTAKLQVSKVKIAFNQPIAQLFNFNGSFLHSFCPL